MIEHQIREGMKPINIEKLLSYSTGISDSYYRIAEQNC